MENMESNQLPAENSGEQIEKRWEGVVTKYETAVAELAQLSKELSAGTTLEVEEQNEVAARLQQTLKQSDINSIQEMFEMLKNWKFPLKEE